MFCQRISYRVNLRWSAAALVSCGGSFSQPVYEEYKGSSPLLTRCSPQSVEIYFTEQHSLPETIKANTITFNVACSSSWYSLFIMETVHSAT